MPSKNTKNTIYFNINGKFTPVTRTVDMMQYEYASDNNETATDFSSAQEATFTLSAFPREKLLKIFIPNYPNCFCNNWRKMHGLPLIRRKRR